ncbi:dTDP-glucose 4,6-dehydratase [Natronogracilivirga saccharolytica]|uniref:dTDP-glucose 4,6-dehydratase n=1 Tax=Natronogracilivirga saccharolytica TaxID=2812953 RepID=A0A8J7RMW5_9BACT|nr:dTDP-glucose 4,6-dehydratase [Natronogracilivirga saccharolytica]MBP3192664.1 dTDP-glucose 4,6-dehydratase [Natronogracilivirga saccharolytica]
MRLLVTGGAGFIGSNLVLHLMQQNQNITLLNIDKLTYASDLSFLEPVEDHPSYRFEKVDLVNRDAVREIVNDFRPDGVMHLAAESHVDNSIKGPEPFVMSNVVGTFNILEECRQLWLSDPNGYADKRFLHVSTDEVYGSLGDEGTFNEETPYAPNSPYSATKAGSDFLVRSYHKTFNMNVVTTNCSNNFGPHQHDEKLIPTVIRKALNHEEIPVYGKGENVRDWLYVTDHCRAIQSVFESGRQGETYIVGGHNEWKNIDLVRLLCDLLNEEKGEGPDGDYKNLITFVTDRAGHDLRYAIDPGKIERELGWKPLMQFDEQLRETVRWYIHRNKKN